MSEKKNEIIDVEASSISQVIDYGIRTNAPIDQLEKFLLLKERFEAGEARKAYHAAMSEFKAHAPEVVLKNKKVNYVTKTGGTVKYNHATLSSIVRAITAGLSKNGLSVSWPSKQAEGKLTVTCKITHIKGHSEEFSLTGPLDDSGGKNAIQSLGSTASYLERYTLLMATGLATEDMDDDGKATATEYIDEKQKSQLVDMCADKGVSLEKFCSKFSIKELVDLPKAKFQQAVIAISAVKKAK
jgi:hypothetical protein